MIVDRITVEITPNAYARSGMTELQVRLRVLGQDHTFTDLIAPDDFLPAFDVMMASATRYIKRGIEEQRRRLEDAPRD